MRKTQLLGDINAETSCNVHKVLTQVSVSTVSIIHHSGAGQKMSGELSASFFYKATIMKC